MRCSHDPCFEQFMAPGPLLDLLALFIAMLGLAALPSSSVALVVVHGATVGARSGLAVAAGIVAADLLFVALAIVGMTTLAQALGSLFALLRYAAAGYLIWVGVGLIRSAVSKAAAVDLPLARTIPGAFTAGFLLTLGDVKAILFYASLFPVFVDLAAVGLAEIIAILAVTVVAVGGVKAFYALTAQRIAVAAGHSRAKKPAQVAAGAFMLGAGGYLLLKS